MPGADTSRGTAGRRLGRFALLRELGRGAQGSVWLAHDPRLQREVAVKLLDPGADPLALSEWLQEARAVSRLNHPNIVPVFEADDSGGRPHLVFEYVPGPTLAQARRERAKWPPREAVQMMLGVLDALAAAHAQGIVHRDLKPSNVLLGSDGRPRVMDFGIAARTAAGTGARPSAGLHAAPGRIVGTPGYISPEAARGEAPLPAMDVFAAGVMLGELLAGEALLRETEPLLAIQRVQHEDLRLPETLEIDDMLRGIVQRALARERAARYDSARALHAALSEWLQAGSAAAAPAPDAGHGTLDFLLRRMRRKSDFPALSQSVVRIQSLATSDTETLSSLAEAILKDVALTNKLLRMVNSAHFKPASGGGVTTVSRAVAMVGFAGIRNMALSLVLLEHMNDKSHAAHLRDEFLRALMAGTLAGELMPAARDREEAFLASMFQNLGRLLTEFYFPEEALQIRQALPAEGAGHARREAESARVLGLGFDELGAGIARQWGLPETLQRAMRTPEGDMSSRRPDRGVDQLRWLGRSANALADAMLTADPAQRERDMLAVAEACAPALGLGPRQILAAAQQARGRLRLLTDAMGVSVARDSVSHRLLDAEAPRPLLSDAPTLVLSREGAGAGAPVMAPNGLLGGLEQVSAAVAGRQMRLNEVLQLVLRTMQQALNLRCVVFGLRDAASNTICGRFGLGEAAPQVSRALRVPLAAAQGGDLFATLCVKGADTLIADTGAGTVAHRLPDWYRHGVNAATFLLLPLVLNKVPVGLIYADKAVAGSIVLSEPDLALLRALRDQVLTAFRNAQA